MAMSEEKVLTTQHDWHEMTIAPVEVMWPDGSPEPIVVQKAPQNHGVTCMKCLAQLAEDTVRTECPGEQGD